MMSACDQTAVSLFCLVSPISEATASITWAWAGTGTNKARQPNHWRQRCESFIMKAPMERLHVYTLCHMQNQCDVIQCRTSSTNEVSATIEAMQLKRLFSCLLKSRSTLLTEGTPMKPALGWYVVAISSGYISASWTASLGAAAADVSITCRAVLLFKLVDWHVCKANK